MRSLERCARVCMAGVGFERIDPIFPACLFEEEEQAVRVRRPVVRSIVAAVLVVLLVMCCVPWFERV